MKIDIKQIDKIRLDMEGNEIYPFGHPKEGQLVPLEERKLSSDSRPPKSWAEIRQLQEAEYDDETKKAMSVLKKKGLI